MEFIPAKWFHVGRLKPIRLIVIHCTVSSESSTGAEAVARYFQRGERRASAHRTADNDSTVMSVKDEDTAFAAAGANSDGIHLELVGMPDQTEQQWLDAFSKAMLAEAASTVREWSREYGVPLRWLTVAQVADGRTKGLCTHADVSLAFPDVSTGHYDPGPHFPKAEALRIWNPASQPPEDDDMPRIVKADSRPEVWVTDGIHKRLLEDEEEAAELAIVGLAKWNDGKPFRMTLDVLSDIPTVAK